MNLNQIKKLQKKVGKKVDADISIRREAEEKKRKEQMSEIQEAISRFEKEFPARGKCLCIWNGCSYLMDESAKRVVADPRFRSVNKLPDTFACVHTEKGKSYYMLTDSAVSGQKEYMEWVAKNYGTIKLAQVALKKEDISAGDKLKSMYMMGQVGEEMTKKFPERSIHDLREAVKALDEAITR